MKILNFYKYQGTGNDFVMIDNRNLMFDSENLDLVRRLCDRKFGIGADGLILVQKHSAYDFEMIYFNADGSQSLCGNGSRCAVHFASFLGMIKKKTTFLAIDGAHDAFIDDDLIHLKMNDVSGYDQYENDYFINTGSPHYIKIVENARSYNVFEEGRKIRYNDIFSEKGTNVNFVELKKGNHIFVRTYERGVENETLSCGTGVTAASLAASFHNFQSPVSVATPGGDLQVSFIKSEGGFTDIYLIGPAEMVFEGYINI